MLEQIMSDDHMKFFICCAGGHDLAHDFCVPRMKKHYNKLLHGLQSMSIPVSGGGKRKQSGGVRKFKAAMMLTELRAGERVLLAAEQAAALQILMVGEINAGAAHIAEANGAATAAARGNLEQWQADGGHGAALGLNGGAGAAGGGGVRPLYRICRKNSAAIYRCKEFVSEYLFSILGLRENDAFMQGPWRIDLMGATGALARGLHALTRRRRAAMAGDRRAPPIGDRGGPYTAAHAAAAHHPPVFEYVGDELAMVGPPAAAAAAVAAAATEADRVAAGYYLDTQLRYLSYYIRRVVEEELSYEFIREDYQWIDYIRTHFFNDLPTLDLGGIIIRIEEAWNNDFITEVDWLVRTCNNHFVLLAEVAGRGGARQLTHENAAKTTQSLLLWLNQIPPPAAPAPAPVAAAPAAAALAMHTPATTAVKQPVSQASVAGLGLALSQTQPPSQPSSQPPPAAPVAAPADAEPLRQPDFEKQGGGGRTKKGGATVAADLERIIKNHFAGLNRGNMTTGGILDMIFQARQGGAIGTWPPTGGLTRAAYLKHRMKSVKTALKKLSDEGSIIPSPPISKSGAIGGKRWTRGLRGRGARELTPVMKNFVSRVRQKIAEVVMLWSNANAALLQPRAPTHGKNLFHLQAKILENIRQGGKGQANKDKNLLRKVAKILGVKEAGKEGGEGAGIITAAKGGAGEWARRIVINNAAIGNRRKRPNEFGNNSVLKDKIICTHASDIDGGARTSIAHQCTYKAAHQVNKNHECGEERITFRTENGLAAYKFYGTLCNNANTAVPPAQRLNAPKKRITLEITFPNNGASFTARTNLEITLKNSNDVQLKCVYFDKVIPAIAEFVNSPARADAIAARRTGVDKLDIIFDTILGHDQPITKIIYAKELDKSIGDVGQEFNGYLRGAGYRAAPAYDAGCRAPPIDQYLPVTYTNYLNNEPDVRPPRRLIIANDAPSGARIIWGLKCLEAKNKNMNAYGGFWSSENQYLTKASVGICSVTAGGGRRRKTRRRKRKPRPTRKRRRGRRRRRARRSRRKRRRWRRKTHRN